MKTLPSLLIILGFLAFGVAQETNNAVRPDDYPPPQPNATAAGRFQLFAGQISETDGSNQRPAVFRIDTATGQTWTYDRDTFDFSQYGGPNKILIEGWSPISESYANNEFYWMKVFKKPILPTNPTTISFQNRPKPIDS